MDSNKSNTNTLAVRDLSISAYLYSCDEVKLVKAVRDGSKDVIFHFSPKEQAERLVTLYRTDSAPPIQPKKLMNSLRNLKDMIFQGV